MPTPMLFAGAEDARIELGQYFTPEWAAHALVQRYFGDLGPSDLVIEPSCGPGAFLKAIPTNVRTIGVEIDPTLAARATANSGREIIIGDFCTVPLPDGVTAIIGNPPFEVSLISRFLSRAAAVLPPDARAGFILPAYALQTHSTVERWRNHFSIAAEFMPRTLFPGLSKPLAFVLFTKNYQRRLFGFCLYQECVEMDRIADSARAVLNEGRPKKGVWRALVEAVLEQLGGEADLQAIYRSIEPRRPTPNAFWKEQVRKVLQESFVPAGHGRWKLGRPTNGLAAAA